MKKNFCVFGFISILILSLFSVCGYSDEAGVKKFEKYMAKQIETTKKGYSVDCYLADNKSNITKISKKGVKSKFSYSDGRIVITDNNEKSVMFQYYPQYKGWVKMDYTAKKGSRKTRANNNSELKINSKKANTKIENIDFEKDLKDLTKFYDDIKYMKDEKINGYDCAVFVLSPTKEYEGVYDKGEIVYIMKSTGLEICTKGTDGYVMNNINVKVGLKDSEFNIPEDAKIYSTLKELVKNSIGNNK